MSSRQVRKLLPRWGEGRGISAAGAAAIAGSLGEKMHSVSSSEGEEKNSSWRWSHRRSGRRVFAFSPSSSASSSSSSNSSKSKGADSRSRDSRSSCRSSSGETPERISSGSSSRNSSRSLEKEETAAERRRDRAVVSGAAERSCRKCRSGRSRGAVAAHVTTPKQSVSDQAADSFAPRKSTEEQPGLMEEAAAAAGAERDRSPAAAAPAPAAAARAAAAVPRGAGVHYSTPPAGEAAHAAAFDAATSTAAELPSAVAAPATTPAAPEETAGEDFSGVHTLETLAAQENLRARPQEQAQEGEPVSLTTRGKNNRHNANEGQLAARPSAAPAAAAASATAAVATSTAAATAASAACPLPRPASDSDNQATAAAAAASAAAAAASLTGAPPVEAVTVSSACSSEGTAKKEEEDIGESAEAKAMSAVEREIWRTPPHNSSSSSSSPQWERSRGASHAHATPRSASACMSSPPQQQQKSAEEEDTELQQDGEEQYQQEQHAKQQQEEEAAQQQQLAEDEEEKEQQQQPQCGEQHRRKRRKRRKSKQQQRMGAAGGKLEVNEENEEEEEAALLQQASPSKEEEHKQQADTAAAEEYTLLMKRPLFDSEKELRWLFGAGVACASAEGGGGGPSQPSRRSSSGSRRRDLWLLPHAANFAAAAAAREHVRMECIAAGSSSVEFELQFTRLYEVLRMQFNLLLQAGDRLAFLDFLGRHPFFIDALLHAAEVFEQHQQQPQQQQQQFHIHDEAGGASLTEPAAKLYRRTLAVLQHVLHFNFSPFKFTQEGFPQVSMDPLHPCSKILFKCLWAHAAALSWEGLYRTALEFTKLLLAMDLLHDACHALLHLDYLAVRARQWQYLLHFAAFFVQQHSDYVTSLPSAPASSSPSSLPSSSPCCSSSSNSTASPASSPAFSSLSPPCSAYRDLTFCLPNFAFSCPLAAFLHNPRCAPVDAVRTITAADLLSPALMPDPGAKRNAKKKEGKREEIEDEEENSKPLRPHLQLMRALLLFPLFLRKFLEFNKLSATHRVTGSVFPTAAWETFIFSPPFWDAHHRAAARDKTSALQRRLLDCYIKKTNDLWKADPVMRWLHSCAAQLFYVYKDSSELQQRTEELRRRPILFDIQRYDDVTLAEFEKYPRFPAVLQEETDFPAEQRRGQSGRRFVRYVSVNSSPIIIFFQTLLPWTELDLTGLKEEPVFVSTLLNYLFSFVLNVSVRIYTVTRNWIYRAAHVRSA